MRVPSPCHPAESESPPHPAIFWHSLESRFYGGRASPTFIPPSIDPQPPGPHHSKYATGVVMARHVVRPGALTVASWVSLSHEARRAPNILSLRRSVSGRSPSVIWIPKKFGSGGDDSTVFLWCSCPCGTSPPLLCLEDGEETRNIHVWQCEHTERASGVLLLDLSGKPEFCARGVGCGVDSTTASGSSMESVVPHR